MPADTTHKVDPVVLLQIFNAHKRVKYQISQNLRVKTSDGSRGVKLLCLEVHAVPLAIDQEGELVLTLRMGASALRKFCNVEVHAQCLHERLRSVIFQGLQHTVVVEDLQVVSGVEQGHEVVEWLFTSVIVTFGDVFLTTEFANVVSGLGPVMAIGDVESGDGGERSLKEVSVFLGAAPEDVTDAIVACHVAVAFLLGNLVDSFFDGFLVVAEGEEDGADVGVLDVSELGAVLLLLGEGELMALDELSLVVLDRGEAHDATLGVAFHRLLVDVEGRFIILLEEAFVDEVLQVVTALKVDRLIIRVSLRIKVNLRLVDMQEGHFVALGHFTSLNSVECVISG